MVGRTSESQTKNKDIVIISYPNLSVAHFKGACVRSWPSEDKDKPTTVLNRAVNHTQEDQDVIHTHVSSPLAFIFSSLL